jgi:hypothetical protein
MMGDEETGMVSISSADPVKIGLVASRDWPGNVTVSATLAAQRRALLRELVPPAARGAVLVNPADATRTQFTVIQLQ